MNLSIEQQLTNEVLYLHSLWHIGPPSSSSSSATPNPNPTPITATTSFKKKKKKKQPVLSKVVEVEWPVEPGSPLHSEPGWPEPAKLTTTIEEQEKGLVSAIHLQQKSVKACQEFFGRNCDSDDDGEEEEEEEEEEGMEDGEEEEFFLKVFKEDNELRNYYEKNFECGEFCCLVCGGIGEKVGKRFKNCVAVVQHSIAISKTKRRNAHRAFGQAVCRVLGWNIERLPSFVLSMDEPLGRVLVKEGSQENIDNGEDSVPKADHVGGDQDVNIHNNIVDSVDLEKVDQTGKEVVDTLSNVEVEWRIKPISPPQTELSWPEPVKLTNLVPCIEEQEKVVAIQLQQKSVKACHEFFSRDRDSDDDGEEEEEDDEEDRMEDGKEESEEEFFLKVFKEDNDLRNYYEKNFEFGEFCCLVCGGIGEKVGKRFKNCVALVQHSIAVSKTKRRNAHRAFGQAVCQVLGWNFERLPSFVLSLDESRCRVLVKAGSQENNDSVEDSVTKADNVSGDQDY
ncbi:hypothetical protein AQUCO_03900133v1 [Aquilegia coerulea]|uniref:Uncharacterized protein n=1 Tax=Aquilegia coerulea TaxID=218851 RepID=A0A2G5CRU2_AQUCA|nr:hypothetical protein AQUCO_03900133v1 [Aquilegia coerulea]PIA34022.1 hypothetical protein AQUCO_03900133v1 [Aquilegia coerulea]